MLLQLPEDLLAQGIGDLRVDARVLDILVAEMIRDVFNSTAGFQGMHGHRVAKGMNRTLLDTSNFGVIVEELLHLAFLQGALAAGKQVGPDIPPLAEIAAQQCGRMPPQRLLSPESYLNDRTW
jgi:hypothetical protein